METRIVVDADGQPVEFIFDDRPIPILTGLTADGDLVTARTERPRRPANECDHAGATWSSELELHCPWCGVVLFVPPRYLAYRPDWEITAMHELWCAAGWPTWRGAGWQIDDHWTVVAQPLFARLGGLPVREDRWPDYNNALVLLRELL